MRYCILFDMRELTEPSDQCYRQYWRIGVFSHNDVSCPYSYHHNIKNQIHANQCIFLNFGSDPSSGWYGLIDFGYHNEKKTLHKFPEVKNVVHLIE
jgi:hypothetical protein